MYQRMTTRERGGSEGSYSGSERMLDIIMSVQGNKVRGWTSM